LSGQRNPISAATITIIMIIITTTRTTMKSTTILAYTVRVPVKSPLGQKPKVTFLVGQKPSFILGEYVVFVEIFE